MNYNSLCYNCFCQKPVPGRPCGYCGFDYNPENVKRNCLLPGTLLNARYIVGVALGVGGFGITYKCLDTKVGGICAVKEYFPSAYAGRTPGSKTVRVDAVNADRYGYVLKRFIEEAKMLRTLNHPNIIRTFDSFMENNTAYYVMEYCNGVDLRSYSSNFKRRLSGEEGLNIMTQVMNGLEYIHGKNILHRDIAPDNIYVTKNNQVKILDFGAARREMDQEKRQLSRIVKEGYAPYEQYSSKSKQGSYTDIYALGATFYHLFTGTAPTSSTLRAAGEELTPLSHVRPDLPSRLTYCIDKCLAVYARDRLQRMEDLRYVLGINSEKQNASSKRIRLAGIATRSLAYIIDFCIVGFVFLVMFVAACMSYSEVAMAACVMFFPIAMFVYGFTMEACTGKTLGKMLTGIYVRGGGSEKADISQIVLRNLIKLLGVFCLIPAGEGMMLQEKLTTSVVCEKI